MTAIPEKEVLRYLGNAKADEPLLTLVRSVSAELRREVAPAGVFRRMPISVGAGVVEADGFRFDSAALAKALDGCREAFFVAATLGAAADRLLRKYAALDIARAAVWQAACAALLEQYLDDQSDALQASAPGLFPRPRFSPGYGDLDLSSQKAMFAILDLGRRLGMALTDGYMMLPEKSVTAIVGLGPERHAAEAACAACDKRDCAQRRDGHGASG